MGIYVTYEKKLGPGPKNWGRGRNIKMIAKIRGYKIKSQLKDGINPKAIHSVHGIDPR